MAHLRSELADYACSGARTRAAGAAPPIPLCKPAGLSRVKKTYQGLIAAQIDAAIANVLTCLLVLL